MAPSSSRKKELNQNNISIESRSFEGDKEKSKAIEKSEKMNTISEANKIEINNQENKLSRPKNVYLSQIDTELTIDG